MATITPREKNTASRKPAQAKQPEIPEELKNAAQPPIQPQPEIPEAADGADAVKQALASNDLVRFYVPQDPTNGDRMFFERSINGHILRLKAGTVMELPLWLVEFIESRLEIQRLSDAEYEAYTRESGVKIG